MRDEVLRSDQVAHTPAGGIECLANRTNGQREICNLGGEGGYSRKWDVVKSIVDLVGEDYDRVLHTDLTNGEEFFAGEDFADGVVTTPRLVGRVSNDIAGHGRRVDDLLSVSEYT